MAKRKKNRTHKLKPNTNPSTEPSPKSFIIKSTPAHHTSTTKNGIKSDSYNSTSLNLLVKDFRKVMEPNTASNLRERKSNRFKDFLAMAGPLGVTHMIVFSQSLTRSKSINQPHIKDEEIMSSINLKIYKVPRGPTLSFKVLRYSLMIDILNADKAPRSPGQEFKTEPLLIMNNFNPTPTTTTDEANQLNLLTTTFRNLFPQIKIQEIQLIQTRRIVLLSYNPITKTIDFRHYLITVKPIGVSKNIRKLMEGSMVNTKSSESNTSTKKRKRVLDLSGVEDLAEYVLGQTSINKTKGPASIASSGGFTADRSELEKSLEDYDGISSGGEDESENEINENKIELPQHYLGKGNLKNSKKSIKLKELGPRLELGLVKIEQGLGNGDVLFHEFIKKTKEEEIQIKKTIKEKEKLRLSRKAEQDANVKKKKLALEAKKEMKANKRKEKKDAGEEGEEEDDEEEEEEEAEGEEEEEEEGSEIDEDAEYSDLFDDEDLSEAQASESTEEDSDDDDDEMSNTKKKTVRFTKS